METITITCSELLRGDRVNLLYNSETPAGRDYFTEAYYQAALELATERRGAVTFLGTSKLRGYNNGYFVFSY